MDVRYACRWRFASKKLAEEYMEANHLSPRFGWHAIQDGLQWRLDYEKADGGTVTDRLRPIYEAHSDDRNSFIAAAIEAGFKKGTATTMWYNLKKEMEA